MAFAVNRIFKLQNTPAVGLKGCLKSVKITLVLGTLSGLLLLSPTFYAGSKPRHKAIGPRWTTLPWRKLGYLPASPFVLTDFRLTHCRSIVRSLHENPPTYLLVSNLHFGEKIVQKMLKNSKVVVLGLFRHGLILHFSTLPLTVLKLVSIINGDQKRRYLLS